MSTVQEELARLRARCNRLEAARAAAVCRAQRAEENVAKYRELYRRAMEALTDHRDAPTVPRELAGDLERRA